MMIVEGLTFDDVLLVPQFSELTSRSQADISTQIGGLNLKVPIISANMDTVTGFEMAVAMGLAGGAGVLHRYKTPDEIIDWLKMLRGSGFPAIPSIGVQDIDHRSAVIYREYTDAICIDIAHGDSRQMLEMVKFCDGEGYNTIIAGNIVTKKAAEMLYQAGANVLKVGVGPGSVCTTRIVTGHGYPQLSAIENVANSAHDAYIIADGGIRNSGDIVKALAMGADAVMIGGLFAGCNETPFINGGVYRGMASAEAQIDFKGKVSNNTAEGVSMKALAKGSVNNVLDGLVGGIRSGLSYSGAKNIPQLQTVAQFVRITSNGLTESHPHGVSS